MYFFQIFIAWCQVISIMFIPEGGCLLINEVSFTHEYPFIEIAREPTLDDDLTIPIGHYGLLIMELIVDYKKYHNKGTLPRFKIRAAFDLSGLDFSQNFKIIGNTPTLRDWIGKMNYYLRNDDNWLRPAKKSATVVVLTYNVDKPLLSKENWIGTDMGSRKPWIGLAGNLHKYVVDNSYDMVSLGDANVADADSLQLYNEYVTLFSLKDPTWYLKSEEEELEPKSHNRCHPYNKRFSLGSFENGTPTPGLPNVCPRKDLGEAMDTNENQCEPTNISQERLSAIKRTVEKLDSEWIRPQKNDWGYVANLVKTNQNDKLNYKYFLKPEVQEWIEYLIDPTDPTKNKIRYFLSIIFTLVIVKNGF